MSEAKHTPGPWMYNKNVGAISGVVGNGQYIVAEIMNGLYPSLCPTDTTIANGRLIAMVPELLESCQKLTAREYAGHNGTCISCGRTKEKGHANNCEWIAAKAAIAKATHNTEVSNHATNDQ